MRSLLRGSCYQVDMYENDDAPRRRVHEGTKP
jgi:hypothetical protein